jgi:cell division FtsZ-interacting protein ZapD
LSEHKNKTEEIIQSDKHIMISYNTESIPLCLKIKDELEKSNYKVWIDINEIHGSSLDSMAKAVENAMCVLICVTEKYRQSNNCQVNI